ncbi:TetR/AcrR family transcriptional regulator [Mycobacterium sp. SMC-4]|uniref:TetR/AcrR family transcriptional regulator n=1 Tax=Mycobacterium sp. SMC-4 TaxID=2857059 RepID=UPI0021B170F0|nr:TetR/AcrR family transcriptional regulator [Mycobacterium sp. SMC-4]UXA16392.1 TetR/AcrR family transcriptional regulator; helix-turn-helix transcriptional regulator [Mycobacterium sp. SMC-4]
MNTTADARPRRADAARNRQLLLRSAHDAFAKHGVNASLDDVARAAGVGPGTLYRHFPSRDALVLAVIDEGLTALHRLGTRLLEAPDPLGALREWLQAYIEQGAIFTGLAATLASPPDPGDDSDSTCQLARKAGAALIDHAISHGVVRDDLTAQDVMDMAAAITWVGDQPDRDAAQRDRLLAVLIDGLHAGTPSRRNPVESALP